MYEEITPAFREAVAIAEARVRRCVEELDLQPGIYTKARMMWTLGFVHMQDLETFRPAGGWKEAPDAHQD